MFRQVPVIAIVCCLSPSWASAQSAAPGSSVAATPAAPRTQFTVSAASAGIYQFPTTASPVLGNVPRGTVLDVTRELGSWVRVPWPAAQDGVAYVHVSMGAMTQPVAPAPGRTTAVVAQPAGAPQPVAESSAAVAATRVPGAIPLAPPSMYVPPPTHRFGLGGRITGASSIGFAATARAWRRDRLGIQLEVSHTSFTSGTEEGHLSSMFIGASALYSMKDRVSDYYSLRPYIGGGAGLQRQALSEALDVPDSSSNGLGVQTAGGVEITFASVPQLGVSTEAGYRWSKKPFPGFDAGGFGIAVSGHWYFR